MRSVRKASLCTIFAAPIYAWVVAALVAADAAPQPPIHVDRTHRLMLDQRLFESLDGLALLVNQPAKCQSNPVLTWDKPWEGNCVILWGSVLYDNGEKCFKMWYEAYRKFSSEGGAHEFLCFATSRDGINWAKPGLGFVAYQGSTANNIVMAGPLDAPTVLPNPDPKSANRYLLYYYRGSPDGIRRSVSTDGLHWRHDDRVLIASGDRNAVTYDPIRKKFCAITRPAEKRTCSRTCGLWESDDGLKFDYIGEIAAPDRQDAAGTEFYGMIPFRYEGLMLGFLEPFFVPRRKLDTQLMYSRDGRAWQRTAGHETFLPWGPPAAWDRAWVTPAHNPPIRVGDKLYIYYQGRQTLHWAAPPFGHIGSIGLAFLRPDGFVSLEPVEPADPKAWKIDTGQKLDVNHQHRGTAVTVPLLLDGARLHLNGIARPGSIRVEVLDADGDPMHGFTADDCMPMNMIDSLDFTVKWRGDKDLRELAQKPIRLRFSLQGARLYSFWVE